MLAIIIPAYKDTYLEEAILSIIGQTDKRYKLYIFDDASIYNIKDIYSKYSHNKNIKYHRFESNLGQISLPRHWNRCIQMVKEDWIWLFSDDDIASKDCVECFYSAIKEGNNSTVLRFDTIVIDGKGKPIRHNPPNPKFEEPQLFLYHRLMGDRFTYAQDHIFKKEAYLQFGGFKDFPLAWCSDDVAWFQFSKSRVIRTLPTIVYWRISGINISSSNKWSRKNKLKAIFDFANWAENEINRPLINERIQSHLMQDALWKWLVRNIGKYFNIGEMHYVIYEIKKLKVSINRKFPLIRVLSIRINEILNS